MALVEPSPDNVLARITTASSGKPRSQTNFILANKMSVRSLRSVENEAGNRLDKARSQGDLRKAGLGYVGRLGLWFLAVTV